jgi:hypothetical protein
MWDSCALECAGVGITHASRLRDELDTGCATGCANGADAASSPTTGFPPVARRGSR